MSSNHLFPNSLLILTLCLACHFQSFQFTRINKPRFGFKKVSFKDQKVAFDYYEQVTELDFEMSRRNSNRTGDLAAESVLMSKTPDGNPNQYLTHDINVLVFLNGTNNGTNPQTIRGTVHHFGYHLYENGAENLLRVWAGNIAIVSKPIMTSTGKHRQKVIILSYMDLAHFRTGVYLESAQVTLTFDNGSKQVIKISTTFSSTLKFDDFITQTRNLMTMSVSFKNHPHTLVFYLGKLVFDDEKSYSFKVIPQAATHLSSITSFLTKNLNMDCIGDMCTAKTLKDSFNRSSIIEGEQVKVQDPDAIREYIERKLYNESEIVFINGRYFAGSFEKLTPMCFYGKEIMLSLTNGKSYSTIEHYHLEPKIFTRPINCYNRALDETLTDVFHIVCPIPMPTNSENQLVRYSFAKNEGNSDGSQLNGYLLGASMNLIGYEQELGKYALEMHVIDKNSPYSSLEMESMPIEAVLGKYKYKSGLRKSFLFASTLSFIIPLALLMLSTFIKLFILMIRGVAHYKRVQVLLFE